MKKLLFVIVLFFFSNSYSQDTLEYVKKNLSFYNPIEQKSFNSIVDEDKNNYFDLAYSINNDNIEKIDADKKAFLGFIDRLRKKISNYNNKKKIKIILKETEKNYLIQSDDQSFFYEIYSKGKYNNMTGTVLYSIILKRLNIPFKIINEFNKVSIVAFPKSENILIEPKSAYNQMVSYNGEYVKGFVEMLKETKQIEKNDLELEDNQVFKKYFLKNDFVSLKALIGMLYGIRANIYMLKNFIPEAVEYSKKMYILYESNTSKYILLTLLKYNIAISDYTKIEDIKSLILYSNISKNEKLNLAIIKNEFIRILVQNLTNRYNEDLLTKFDKLMVDNLFSSELTDYWQYVYNYEKGRVLYNKLEFEKSFSYLEKAYTIEPENADVKNMFFAAITQKIKKVSSYKTIVDTMYSIKIRHDSLNSNKKFMSLYAVCYLYAIEGAYNERDIKNAEEYRRLFEKIADNNDIELDTYGISSVYSKLAMYYFSRNSNSRARVILKKGLHYAPDSYELKHKLKIVNS